mmetsp:Transcript_8024/g.23974  ORF Transcript_8024/g.23974 Transcript_8024/m.23974 type:complete len:206 (-) Transcript_8024:1033-1650(-)
MPSTLATARTSHRPSRCAARFRDGLPPTVRASVMALEVRWKWNLTVPRAVAPACARRTSARHPMASWLCEQLNALRALSRNTSSLDCIAGSSVTVARWCMELWRSRRGTSASSNWSPLAALSGAEPIRANSPMAAASRAASHVHPVFAAQFALYLASSRGSLAAMVTEASREPRTIALNGSALRPRACGTPKEMGVPQTLQAGRL